jgi:hypothetical protein
MVDSVGKYVALVAIALWQQRENRLTPLPSVGLRPQPR